jgi:hypothetical protein
VQRDGAVPTLRTVTATKGRYSSLTPPPWLFIDHLYTLISPGLDSVFVVRIERPRNQILTEFDWGSPSIQIDIIDKSTN